MTMDLVGPGGEQHFNHSSWRMLLDLALRHGWQPAGVVEAEPEPEEDDELTVELDAAAHTLPPESPLAQAIASFLPPADDSLLCPYFSNSGHRVTDADAAALADALERALPDVPRHDAMEEKTFVHPAEPGVRLVDVRTPVNPYEWYSGKQALLRDFIAFCRQGDFELCQGVPA